MRAQAPVVSRMGGTRRRAIRPRAVVVCGLLAAAVLLVCVVALGVGDISVSPGEVVSVLLGGGERTDRLVVIEWRLPRVLAAVVFGAALAVSGAIFQSLTRNPLASPDILGFSAGSHTGALIVIILFSGGYAEVASGALAGGLLSAVGVYLLSVRTGLQGFRLIVVGIALASTLGAVNTWMLLRADRDAAMTATAWGTGTLSTVTWDRVVPATVLIVVVLIVLRLLAPLLSHLELGDDAARALGLRVESAKLALIVVGVALIAVPTAISGPIAFVALAAPHIARLLLRGRALVLTATALTGSLVLATADLTAQHLWRTPLPVGVATVVLGGAYLVWLLLYEIRRTRS
ncbi:putative ferric enterobactin transport system permease protein [Nocardia nova SH22a]|uniref:Putative ferric enterobactin transport system permease protein n=1 Tax=Nocardia nova SH22a TaxID=1415166 RepID=W5THB5_9NOCA|nr:iron chelate uptake ABC transporter family permease subunit [Nocardia nova]AHH18358.1 putative ferric enterobactin transport system permease protein [Nocardia nova SH22a]